MELFAALISTSFLSLISLSLSGGFALIMLLHPRRERANLVFSAFCGALWLWALLLIRSSGTGVEFYLLASAVGVAAFTFFFFSISFVKVDHPLTRLLMWASPICIMVGLFIVWSGQAEVGIERGWQSVIILPLGYVAWGLNLLYIGAVMWISLRIPDERARLLRIPALLLALSYALTASPDLAISAPPLLLAAGALGGAGWVLLNTQLFTPLLRLGEDARVANRNLQQAVGDLRLEKSRAEALNRELETASQYKSQFLDSMSHELRTPLNSIVGYSELLESGIYGELTERQRDRLEKIHRNGKNLLESINLILDLSKVEAGRLQLDAGVIDINHLIDQAMTAVQPERERKGLSLASNILPQLPALYGDGRRIQQVLVNLLSNAIKFTESGQIVLEAQMITVENGTSSDFKLPFVGWLKDGVWVVVSVTDTGMGISPEDQARIFDEFGRADNVRAAQIEGTGLGLAITKKLVEMHEGAIWVKSALQQGSTFFVALPAHDNARIMMLNFNGTKRTADQA